MKRIQLIMNGSVCLLVLGAVSPAFAADRAASETEAIDGFRDTPMVPGSKWHLHDPDRPQPRVVTPGAAFSQNAPAPSDAEVLFDGKDLSKWQSAQGQDGEERQHLIGKEGGHMGVL